MFITLIEALEADQAAHGEVRQGRAFADDINRLRTALHAEFGAVLPQDYALFLRHANGLDYNGLVLYGATQSQAAPGPGGFWQGLCAANRLWREGPGHENLLVLGETDLDLLTVTLAGAEPSQRDKVSGDLARAFESVTDLLQAVISQRL
ncbi:MAG TPA: YrhA family protein [Caulobacter sp.]|nr:YrhA family protein [Caulobacter sp.]